jgi:hypothetical protein
MIDLQLLIRQLCDGNLWHPWLPLDKEQREMRLPNNQGGLYRIRMHGSNACIYIGETENFQRRLENELGRSLRAKTMPNGEHHTASPGLWYLQQTDANCPLQVSLAPLSNISSAQRKGLESLAIALERRNHQRSPTLNYGRMPDGLAKPKRANARNVEPDISDESVPPVGDLFDPTIQQVLTNHWGGYPWSDWMPVSKLRSEKAQGIYRLRHDQDTHLVTIGHGAIAHAASFGPTLIGSYVLGPWSKPQRRELLDDLFALHLLMHARLPGAFGGNHSESPEHFIQYLCRIEEMVMERLWFPRIDIAS